VKIAPDFSDIFIGHATWWTYTSMLKIYKHYTFELQGGQYKTRTTSMSSYPGKSSAHTCACVTSAPAADVQQDVSTCVSPPQLLLHLLATCQHASYNDASRHTLYAAHSALFRIRLLLLLLLPMQA
jgi:hypothetical protein